VRAAPTDTNESGNTERLGYPDGAYFDKTKYNEITNLTIRLITCWLLLFPCSKLYNICSKKYILPLLEKNLLSARYRMTLSIVKRITINCMQTIFGSFYILIPQDRKIIRVGETY